MFYILSKIVHLFRSVVLKSVVSQPVASASPGDLLGMQLPGPQTRPTESETLGVGVQRSEFITSFPGAFKVRDF